MVRDIFSNGRNLLCKTCTWSTFQFKCTLRRQEPKPYRVPPPLDWWRQGQNQSSSHWSGWNWFYQWGRPSVPGEKSGGWDGRGLKKTNNSETKFISTSKESCYNCAILVFGTAICTHMWVSAGWWRTQHCHCSFFLVFAVALLRAVREHNLGWGQVWQENNVFLHTKITKMQHRMETRHKDSIFY